MPRASNGVYSLPASNPVVTGTVVASAWANNTLSDIGTVLSDSLSRSGSGGMTAPLQLAAGAVGAPALTWSLETTSGFYRNAASDFRFAIGAVDKIQFNTNGILVADGAVGTPGFSFIADPNTGIYRIGADNIGIATAGVLALSIDATQHCLFINGTAGAPSISFIADTNTGFYNFAADAVGYSSGGTVQLVFDTTGLAFQGTYKLFATDGAVGTPGITFNLDTNTGIYRSAADRLNFTSGGVDTLQLTTTIATVFTVIQAADGSAGTPAFSFFNDPDTGMYRTAANNPAFSAGGVLVFQYDGFGIYNVAGTVANPSYTFTADSDTGFCRLTANAINIARGGADWGQLVGRVSAIKSSNTSRNTTTAATDDPDLILAIPAAGTYIIRAFLSISGGAGGFRMGFGCTATLGNSLWGATGIQNSIALVATKTTPITTQFTIGPSAANDFWVVEATAVFTSSGNLSISWAQNSSNAANTIVQGGSYLEMTRIA